MEARDFDEDGDFEFDELPEGQYTLTFLAGKERVDDFALEARHANVRGGEVVDVGPVVLPGGVHVDVDVNVFVDGEHVVDSVAAGYLKSRLELNLLILESPPVGVLIHELVPFDLRTGVSLFLPTRFQEVRLQLADWRFARSELDFIESKSVSALYEDLIPSVELRIDLAEVPASNVAVFAPSLQHGDEYEQAEVFVLFADGRTRSTDETLIFDDRVAALDVPVDAVECWICTRAATPPLFGRLQRAGDGVETDRFVLEPGVTVVITDSDPPSPPANARDADLPEIVGVAPPGWPQGSRATFAADLLPTMLESGLVLPDIEASYPGSGSSRGLTVRRVDGVLRGALTAGGR
ncbi:hypothetical protein [Rohdeia mirabilis]|uniref:hypothetical protein n=1 Tax=Rohdeia mirabilis TaxID=2528008 RepID=UPI003AF3715B